MFDSYPLSRIPALTTGQMVEVDRAMMEDYHIELLQMMENAGRNLAHLARERFLQGDPSGKPVVVLSGPPHGAAAELIGWANSQPAPVLALDAPSGLDTTTGNVFTPAIRAAATMTLALPKQGLLAGHVAPYVGELYLADISVPPGLYAGPSLGLAVGSLFARSDIIRLV